jgi:type I restriction enzyme, S subunit
MTAIQGWTAKSLTELAHYINGYAFKPEDWGKEGLPIIRIEQLRNPKASADYFDGRLPSSKIIDDGDLIFSWSASLFLRIWRHGRAALNQHLFKVVEYDGVDRAFLKAFIEFYLPELTAASHGSTMQHITRKELVRFRAPVPTSQLEQAKIAEVPSTVDRAIEQTEALITKWQRIKAGLIHDLFARGVDENGNIRSEQIHPFKDSSLGRIPVEWKIVDLKSLAEFITSGSRGWAKYYSDVGAVFLRIGNLTRDHINLRLDDIVLVNPTKSSEGKRTSVKCDDLLISITADLGIIGVIPHGFGEAYVNQHIALVRLFPGRAVPRFIGWFLSSYNGHKQFAELNESGAKAGLNLPTIGTLKVPLPHPSEQNRIAEILDSSMQMLAFYHRQQAKLRSLKTAFCKNSSPARNASRRCLIWKQIARKRMSISDKIAKEIKLDERNHVEKPLLDQLAGLGWEVLDLDGGKQQPNNTFRESFAEVVMLPVLRQQLKVSNPWLEDDQLEEVVKQLTASWPGTSLIQNNRHAFNLLLESTSVSENRKTGEKSPTVRFDDFKQRDNNRFIAVCQFKVRILGTEHHIIPDIVLFLNGLPVVIIECKSPKVKEPIPEAIDQLLRYSEQRGAKGEGNAPLFYLALRVF